MTDGVSCPLAGDVHLEMRPTSEGVKLSVYKQDDDGVEAVYYSVDETRDFYESSQKRTTLVNRVREKLPGDVDDEAVTMELDTFLSELNFGLDDDTKNSLQAPIVQQLREETRRVVFVPGEELQIRITLASGGEVRTIQFSAGEWTTPNPKPLKDRYLNEFLESIEVSADQWSELKEFWDDMKEIGEREELTKRERAYQDTVKRLRSQKLRVYADQEKMTAPEAVWNAFYDDENEITDENIPDDETVVWVRSDALQEIMNDGPYTADYMAELSQVLREKGATLTKSRSKNGTLRIYPFYPEYCGVEDPELDVNYGDDATGGVEI